MPSDVIWSNLILSNLNQSNLIWSYLVSFDLIWSFLISYVIKGHLILYDTIYLNLIWSNIIPPSSIWLSSDLIWYHLISCDQSHRIPIIWYNFIKWNKISCDISLSPLIWSNIIMYLLFSPHPIWSASISSDQMLL